MYATAPPAAIVRAWRPGRARRYPDRMEMEIPLYFVVVWAASIVFTVLVGAGILTYIRRTWQLIRADGEGSVQLQLLDAMDQVQTQLYAVSERLARLEQGLAPGNGEPGGALPPVDEPGGALPPVDEPGGEPPPAAEPGRQLPSGEHA